MQSLWLYKLYSFESISLLFVFHAIIFIRSQILSPSCELFNTWFCRARTISEIPRICLLFILLLILLNHNAVTLGPQPECLNPSLLLPSEAWYLLPAVFSSEAATPEAADDFELGVLCARWYRTSRKSTHWKNNENNRVPRYASNKRLYIHSSSADK